ncbi:MBL fold metallo-hydrolase [Solibacillus sp. CAU 1738]|uniref:MBL fold metallo-hydrolase n=1 Tax=Solibacillus sp. CAU 1738 TaxID=3140363 RepID=UPI00325FF6F9
MEVHKIIIPTPFAVGDVNAFLVKGDALSLFDAGPKTEDAYEALKWGIRAAGYNMSDIEQVVLTHHHPDHAGWVDAFPKAELLGHRYVDYWMRQTDDFLQYHTTFYREQLQKVHVPPKDIEQIIKVMAEIEFFGTRPLTQFLTDDDEVPGHPGLIAYETPGHAQSHLIFVNEKTAEAIGGDLLLDRVSSNPLIEPPVDLQGDRPKSLLQYNASLKKLRDLHIKKLYTGHGENILNSSELVTERLEKQHQRALKVFQLLQRSQTVYDVTCALFGKVYDQQPGLTLSETLGQLDYLIDEGLAKLEIEDGLYIYKQA